MRTRVLSANSFSIYNIYNIFSGYTKSALLLPFSIRSFLIEKCLISHCIKNFSFRVMSFFYREQKERERERQILLTS
jgi:hypothetical protein